MCYVNHPLIRQIVEGDLSANLKYGFKSRLNETSGTATKETMARYIFLLDGLTGTLVLESLARSFPI
jgi:hypothetical protein